MPGGIVQKDSKITQFINDVMVHCRNRVTWDINDNPISANADKDITYEQLDVKEEPIPTDYHEVPSLGGNVNASALVAMFQTFAHNITRYRPVRMYVRASNGRTITEHGTNPTALNGKHRMAIADFKALVDATPNIANLTPGNPAAEAALNTLIARLQTIVVNNMEGTEYLTISACHNSCHSDCHSSRNRR